jgi:hypothetical protein
MPDYDRQALGKLSQVNGSAKISWQLATRINIRRRRGARLAGETVVNKAKDRVDSPLRRALEPEEVELLTKGVNRS